MGCTLFFGAVCELILKTCAHTTEDVTHSYMWPSLVHHQH